MSENDELKLSVKIMSENYYMSENYDLVYQGHRKVEIYRDTGVSKNMIMNLHVRHLHDLILVSSNHSQFS